MLGRTSRGCLVPVLAILTFSCGGEKIAGNSNLGLEGDSCTKGADCESGLRCVALMCVSGVLPDTKSDIAAEDVYQSGSDNVSDAQRDMLHEVASDTETDHGSKDLSADLCQPECGAKECGDDGCWGQCGSCGVTQICTSDQQCLDVCGSKNCGDNGYGGSCGSCSTGSTGWRCGDDQKCFNPCAGKECGFDGYGGSCGSCDEGSICQSGECTTVWWKDPVSGLGWQTPPVESHMNWSQAKQYCSDLDLDGHTDWRLPTIGELRSLIRGCPATVSGGSCNVGEGSCLTTSCSDDSCKGCYAYNGPANGCYWPDGIQGQCGWNWSSSPGDGVGGGAWLVVFDRGFVNFDSFVLNEYDVRCVR